MIREIRKLEELFKGMKSLSNSALSILEKMKQEYVEGSIINIQQPKFTKPVSPFPLPPEDKKDEISQALKNLNTIGDKLKSEMKI